MKKATEECFENLCDLRFVFQEATFPGNSYVHAEVDVVTGAKVELVSADQ